MSCDTKPFENECGFPVICSIGPGVANLLDIDIRLFIRFDCSWHEPRCDSASNFGAYGSQFLIFPHRWTNNPIAPIHNMSTNITIKASSGLTTILFPVDEESFITESWCNKGSFIEPFKSFSYLENLKFHCYSSHWNFHPAIDESPIAQPRTYLVHRTTQYPTRMSS